MFCKFYFRNTFSGRHISEIISSFEQRSQSSDRSDILRHHQRPKVHSPTKSSAPSAFRRPPTPGAELHKRPSSMVLPDHDSASGYIQKYIDAVTTDSSKHKASSPDSSPPPKKSNVNFDTKNSSAIVAENMTPENLTLQLNSNHEHEKMADNYSQSLYRAAREHKDSQTRKISSSSSSSQSSISTNGAPRHTSNSVFPSDKARSGIKSQTSSETDDEYEPMVTSPDIPSLEEKLIKSGHYQAPKSHSTTQDLIQSSTIRNLNDNTYFTPDTDPKISDVFGDHNEKNNFQKPSIFPQDSLDHGDVVHDEEVGEYYASDLESDEDEPTIYEVILFNENRSDVYFVFTPD